MSTVMNNLLEWVILEICMERKNSVFVSCIYRTPGSDIDILYLKTGWRKKITITNQKVMFTSGYFSIDLLNINKHKMTEEFINTMYSLSMYQKITRPITSHCATLIDNRFSNDIVTIQ